MFQFWPSLETSEKFLMDLEVPCSGDFCVSESRIFFFSLFCRRVSESRICRFSFRLVFRSRIFESSREFMPIQLIELS